MKKILVCMPLKSDGLKAYEEFVNQAVEQQEDCKAMLKRYDIHASTAWHKRIAGRDYIFVCHEVGPNFDETMTEWAETTHPFDVWFRDSSLAACDMTDPSDMEQPRELADFSVSN